MTATPVRPATAAGSDFAELNRRINALDPVDRLAGDPELLDRARALHAESAAARPSVPPRSLILAALAGDAAELTTKMNP